MRQQSSLTTHAVASRLAEYRAPVLVMLGDMRTLTETGSGTTMETDGLAHTSNCHTNHLPLTGTGMC